MLLLSLRGELQLALGHLCTLILGRYSACPCDIWMVVTASSSQVRALRVLPLGRVLKGPLLCYAERLGQVSGPMVCDLGVERIFGIGSLKQKLDTKAHFADYRGCSEGGSGGCFL